MKYVKLFALAAGAFMLTACSDDNDFNSASDVTVEMAKSEITVKENAGTFNVPVKVTGDPNGPVKVKIVVEASASNPALPFEEKEGKWSGNYIITSETINIPADEKTANVEISTVDDLEENPDRSFTIRIESAEGATIGSAATTVVILKDNDSVPYEKVQGTWNFSFNDYDGNPASWTMTIGGYDEGSKEYGNELYLSGLLGYQNELSLKFHNDEATGECYIEMELPEPFMWDNESYLIYALNGMSTAPGAIRGTFSEDLKTITFDPEATIVYYVAAQDISDALGVYDLSSNMSMTRQ